MKISISDDLIKASNGQLTLGIISSKVTVIKHSEQLWCKVQDERMKSSLIQRGKLKELKGISALQTTYKRLGKSTSKFKGSNEALLIRAIQNKLPQINTVVDINNLISIQAQRSVGTYDVSKLRNDIEFVVGAKGDQYFGTKKYSLDLENLPILCDSDGPFGSPTSDSDRALITENTKEILMTIYSFDGDEGLEEQLILASELLMSYADAKDIQKFIVKKEMEFQSPTNNSNLFSGLLSEQHNSQDSKRELNELNTMR